MAVKGSTYLTIGKVVAALRSEFPDLTISKIRYLEDERIIKPQRSKGGYRKFSQDDLERLRLALRLQKERYLPLHVIKEKLDDWGRGSKTPELENLIPEPDSKSSHKEETAKIEEAPRFSGLSASQVQDLQDFGLIEPKITEEGRLLNGIDVEIIKLAGGFLEFGIEPRHLKMYDSLTDREITIFQQILGPLLRQKGSEAKRKTQTSLAKLAELSQEMKRLLLEKGLQRNFPNHS